MRAYQRWVCAAILFLLTLDPSVAMAANHEPLLDKRAKDDGPLISVPPFKTRRSFKSEQEYGQYVQKALSVGCRVRASTNYEKVKTGMTGIYYGTSGGNPPCLVIWDRNLNSNSSLLPNVPRNKASYAYWVYWHQVEILGR